MTELKLLARIKELEDENMSLSSQLDSREDDLDAALLEIDDLKTENNKFRGIIDDIETSVRTAPK